MKNEGHGHVHPREDGVLARCGGPAICAICAIEAQQLRAQNNLRNVQYEQEAPAYPIQSYSNPHHKNGLTKREVFALENHAQMIRYVHRKALTSEQAAVLAVSHADALLKELLK
jgi:hypothetical protein